MAVYAITVTVKPEYLEKQSAPAENRFAFAYTVTIKNTGDITAQVIARHWIITDTNGSIEDVKGLAIVGYQPVLQPGQSFEYTSGAAIETPQGSMKGSYLCIAEDTHIFHADIPEFVLSQPRTLH